MTQDLPQLSASAIAYAMQSLWNGELVIIPTETVYGLAADSHNDHAVARIYEAKGRPNFNPLISHVTGLDMARMHADFSQLAMKLALRFWPGGLTLVLPRKPSSNVSQLATAGLDTIALRVPEHPVARSLIRAVGRPIVAPSANISEQLSPTSAEQAAEQLEGKIGIVLDGGPCEVGLESTIVSLAGDIPTLLRPGAIARHEIEDLTGPLAAPGERVESPGMMKRHYAPRASLRINAEAPEPGEAFLAFGPQFVGYPMNLSSSGDLVEAAANLFRFLHELDKQYDRIAVATIPEHGLGEAINDRLRRAAHSSA